MSETSPRAKILKPVFYPSAILIGLVVLVTISLPEQMEDVLQSVQDYIVDTAGWLYMLSVAGYLFLCIYLAASRFGKVKLGPDHSEPDYSYVAWFSMLFSAGMGIGLLFFSVGEPLMHFGAPPIEQATPIQTAKQSMEISYFHWGVHAWAIYALTGLTLAYFGFRHGLPLTIRSALYPILGDRIHGPIGHAVDIFAVMGTLFGVATSLGYGVSQVNAGLSYLLDIPVNSVVQTVLIMAITGAATISVVSGLDKGIKRLSQLNLFLALGLLAFVFLLGPSLVLLNMFVENLGIYTSSFFDRTFGLAAYSQDRSWMGDWTLFYWGWWISWSPFVGMFIARVSRGRTIREFIVGVLLVPPLFTFFWFTVFGNSALMLELTGAAPDIAEAVTTDLPVALFRFLEYLPLTTITSILAIALVITFFVTSSDSGSLVIDIITAGGQTNTPVWQRVFWAVAEGLIAAVLLNAGGLGALQAAALTAALPFTIVVALAGFGLYRGLSMEGVRLFTASKPTMPANDDGVTWQDTLRTLVEQPELSATRQFLERTVKPALEEVAEEIRSHGATAKVAATQDSVKLAVVGEDEVPDFEYAVRLRGYLTPSFGLFVSDPREETGPRHYRAEVHLASGGQDYSIFGYTQQQVIHDVLSEFKKHMHFLHVAHN